MNDLNVSCHGTTHGPSLPSHAGPAGSVVQPLRTGAVAVVTVVVPEDASTAGRGVLTVAIEVLRSPQLRPGSAVFQDSPRSVVHEASIPLGAARVDHFRVSLGIGRQGYKA